MKKSKKLLLAWALITAMVVPMAVTAAEPSANTEPDHIMENMETEDINISEEEMENTDSDTGTVDEEPVADEILETEEIDIDFGQVLEEGEIEKEVSEEIPETVHRSPNEGFEDFGELSLVEVQVLEEDGEPVTQANMHGTITPDPTMYNKTYSNNTKIKLSFDLRSFGKELDEYRITIFRGKSVDPNDALTRKIGNYDKKVGTTRLVFEWDTTDVGKYKEGIYTIQCIAVYFNGKTDVTNSYEEFKVKLEDYKTVAIRNFVKRLYLKVFNRPADSAGLNDWTNRLAKGQISGGEAVRGFIQSKEFEERNVSDKEYIEILYQTLFDRASDRAGRENWQDALNTGMSRTFVLKGFIDSTEFDGLCAYYGIQRGTINVVENRDKNRGATGFVWRFYQVALERTPDMAGLNDWTGRLVDKKASPEDVGKGFIFSPEVAGKKLSNEDFVKLLYRTFLGREYDSTGLHDWVERLENGMSRLDVFYGFSRSKEFGDIVASFGL